MRNQTVLVTGATGYVGGRLVLRLLAADYTVRAMGRSMDKLRGRTWSDHPRLELAQADIHDPASLKKAFHGCSTAFYLIHSMNPEHPDFAASDRHAAHNFINASNDSGLDRIIYLGGLGGDSPESSRHLKSRVEVGDILCSGDVPTTILRSGQILGSGSVPFEMLRYLAERLPLIIIPSSILDTEMQPICIRNVLNYLVACLDRPETIGRSYDIGGPEVLSYRRLFEIYSEETGIRKPIFITPGLPTRKLGRRFAIGLAKLVLPLPPSISEPLLEGAGSLALAGDDHIKSIIPQCLMTCRESIRRAIQKDSLQIVETRWTDAGKLKPPEWAHAGDAHYAGGTLLQGGFKVELAAEPKDVWPIISRIGGNNGWYYGDLLWQIRGWMDSMVGGVGLRRGRRHPKQLLVGDALDFWRVLEVKAPQRLILVAEMKLPGEAILDFELVPHGRDRMEIFLGTRFRSKGLYGLAYWYVLLPFHDLLFGGMLREVARMVDRPIINGPYKYRPGPIY